MSSSSGVSGITIATFSGSSTFSSSFQQVLTRAVQTAELPIQQMQNDVTNLTGEQSALTSLGSTFNQLQSAVQALDTAVSGSTSATVSDNTVLTATAASGAMPGTYSVQVDDIGSAATAMSNAGLTTVTDPTTGNISASTTFTLSVNGTNTTITPAGSSLDDLVNAINSANAGVQATIVDVGGASGTDYRLSLTDTNMGANTIQLTDSSNSPLMTQLAAGTPVLYKVNGSSTDTIGNSRQITLSPGLTVNLEANSANPVTITVGTTTSGLSSALSTLATDYNAAVTALAGQRGQSGGALTGQSIVFTLQSLMSSISQYSGGTGNIGTLAALGLSVDSTGTMSFNSSTFASLNGTDIATFLGSTSTGGFLKTANDALTGVTDNTSGMLVTSFNSIQDQVNSDNQQIADATTRVNSLQTSLLAQLSQADAAIATLQSQKTFYTELFQAQYGTPGSNGG